jgi:hypothetical protein
VASGTHLKSKALQLLRFQIKPAAYVAIFEMEFLLETCAKGYNFHGSFISNY